MFKKISLGILGLAVLGFVVAGAVSGGRSTWEAPVVSAHTCPEGTPTSGCTHTPPLLPHFETVHQYLRRLNGTFPTEFMGYRQHTIYPEYCYSDNNLPVWGGENAVRSAAESWTTASNYTIALVFRPVCNAGPHNFNSTNPNSDCANIDGLSAVYVVDGDLPDPGDSDYVGPGILCFNWQEPGVAENGRGDIYEMDIILDVSVINQLNYLYAFAGKSETLTLGEIAMHEFGHFLGLGHPQTDDFSGLTYLPCPGTYSVMCAPGEDPHTSENCAQQLSPCPGPTWGDISGILALYSDQDGDGCIGAEEDWITYTKNRQSPLSDSYFSDWGDINSDQTVNAVDLSQESQRFGTYTGPPGKDIAPLNVGNGTINASDMNQLAIQFFWTCKVWSNGLPVLGWD